jgi:hypothetical protein
MDEADIAAPLIEATVEMGIRQARSAPALMPRGQCHFCDEEVADGLRFCGPDCRDDFQAEEEALKRMGKPEVI